MAGVPTWGYYKYYLLHGTSTETEIEKVDVNAEHIISSVKEVGYCLKVYKES